jgi:hypothetical protein
MISVEGSGGGVGARSSVGVDVEPQAPMLMTSAIATPLQINRR